MGKKVIFIVIIIYLIFCKFLDYKTLKKKEELHYQMNERLIDIMESTKEKIDNIYN